MDIQVLFTFRDAKRRGHFESFFRLYLSSWGVHSTQGHKGNDDSANRRNRANHLIPRYVSDDICHRLGDCSATSP